MDPLTLIGLVSAVGPFLMPLVKRALGTNKIEDGDIKGTIHEALVLLLGLVSSVVNSYVSDPVPNWKKAVIVGLAAGAGASFVRNTDKNTIGLAENLLKIFGPKGNSTVAGPTDKAA